MQHHRSARVDAGSAAAGAGYFMQRRHGSLARVAPPDTGDRWGLQARQQTRSGQHEDLSALLHPWGPVHALGRALTCMTARDSICMAVAAPHAANSRALTAGCCDADVQGRQHAPIPAHTFNWRQLHTTDVD